MRIAPIALFVFAFIAGCTESSEVRSQAKPLAEIDKAEYFSKSFKEVLKSKGHSSDIDAINSLETIQPGNLYSNHYLNLAIDFPDSWKHDRGVAEYSIFRAFEPDSGLVLNLMVIPIKEGLRESPSAKISFSDSPIRCLDEQFGGSYSSYIVGELTTQLGSKPLDFKLSERRMGSMHFLLTEYKIKQWSGDVEYYMMTQNWLTQNWGCTYQVTYTVPEMFFNQNVAERAVVSARFLDPKLLN